MNSGSFHVLLVELCVLILYVDGSHDCFSGSMMQPGIRTYGMPSFGCQCFCVAW